MFSSKKQTTRTNQYSQIPTNIEIRGPDSGKLLEISNAINSEFGNNNNLRVFSKVVGDVQYYQVFISLMLRFLFRKVATLRSSIVDLVRRGILKKLMIGWLLKSEIEKKSGLK